MLALVLVGVLTLAAPAQQPTTLPPGIQSSGSLSGAQRDQLQAFIEGNFQVMETGSVAQQRGARDQLLGMFDAGSVSTAFRQAASEFLAPRLEQTISGPNRWNRFAAFRIAARLASEDSARIFEDALDPDAGVDDSDVLMALGQLRVMFLEVDPVGLAVSENTLNRLISAVGARFMETDNEDIALLQARALRALAQGPGLPGVRDAAAANLATAVAARLVAAGNREIGGDPSELDALLAPLETLDGVRAYLVMRQGGARLNPAVANALAQLAGQSVAFVARNYEQTPPKAEDARRYLQRMAQRGVEIATILVGDHNARNPNNIVAPDGMPGANDIGVWLASGDMRSFRLAVVQVLDALAQAFGFERDWAKTQ